MSIMNVYDKNSILWKKKSANKIAEKNKCCEITLKDFRMSPKGGYLLNQINKDRALFRNEKRNV